jgi:hypothetical protein
MKKIVISMTLALVLVLMLVVTASATQPTEIHGFFWYPPGETENYCLATGDGYTPDGFLIGCVDQPDKPGLDQKGVLYLTVDGLTGACDYSLRTYAIDGIARFVSQGCTGELAGFHMKGVGWAANGLWEGSYHFDP